MTLQLQDKPYNLRRVETNDMNEGEPPLAFAMTFPGKL